MTKDLNTYYKIYDEIYKFEDIVLQSNIDGFYTKRIKVNMQELQTIKHNHIKIPINSVIWDIDCHIRVISDKIHDFISSNLIKDNISHSVWDTSRSPHIHAFFKDMNLYTQEVRRDIRLLILAHYSGLNPLDKFKDENKDLSWSEFFKKGRYSKWLDISRCSENQMIRDFGGLHEITGKPKTLIYEFKGTNPCHNKPENQTACMENVLNSTILEQLRVLYHQCNKVPEIACIAPTDSDKKAMQDFITYCCENQHTHDGRKRMLLKNVAIATLLLYPSDTNARHRIYYRITQNCRGCHINNLIGWDKWFQQRKKIEFNWKEIKSFYQIQKEDRGIA